VTPADFLEFKLDAGQERVLVFSDTHLLSQFEPGKFAFLQQAIKQVDRVIINGDFWDLVDEDFTDFLGSAWQQLFPLLKSKQAIYLYGNHDPKRACDERAKLFSEQQAEQLWLKTGSKELLIRHGCYLAPSGDIAHPRLLANRPMMAFGNWLNTVGLNNFPNSYLQWFKRRNRQMKAYTSELENHQWLVTGHSHLQEKNAASRFINTGLIRFGFGQYLLVEEGKLELVNERYSR
jgi:predicted phosphodiesterase